MDKDLLRRSLHLAAKADFSRSGGPGGQNVNKVSTKVTLRIQLNDLSGLNEAEIQHMREMLSTRISKEGEFVISSCEERSRRVNLERAFSRMESLILNAARLPRLRRHSRPSRAAREERLHSKRCRSLIKADRRFKP